MLLRNPRIFESETQCEICGICLLIRTIDSYHKAMCYVYNNNNNLFANVISTGAKFESEIKCEILITWA